MGRAQSGSEQDLLRGGDLTQVYRAEIDQGQRSGVTQGSWIC